MISYSDFIGASLVKLHAAVLDIPPGAIVRALFYARDIKLHDAVFHVPPCAVGAPCDGGGITLPLAAAVIAPLTFVLNYIIIFKINPAVFNAPATILIIGKACKTKLHLAAIHIPPCVVVGTFYHARDIKLHDAVFHVPPGVVVRALYHARHIIPEYSAAVILPHAVYLENAFVSYRYQ